MPDALHRSSIVILRSRRMFSMVFTTRWVNSDSYLLISTLYRISVLLQNTYRFRLTSRTGCGTLVTMKTATTLSDYSVNIINAVRAEASRQGVTTPELARRVGRDRKFFYDRFSFKAAFSTDDIAEIATALGITAADIIRSARMGAEMKNQGKAA